MSVRISEYTQLAEQVLAVYEQAEETMMSAISNRLNKDLRSSNWQEKKLAEMSAVTKQMRKIVYDIANERTELTDGIIKTAYAEGSNSFVSEARQFAKDTGIAALSPNAPKVVEILNDLNHRYDAADRMILRNIDDAYADIVGKAAARVATGTITIRQAIQNELEDFADRGISSFVDKNGHMWDMATYAEMATITAIERATRYGYIDTMQEYGYDLAIVSSHANACPLCVAWEDVIISVSGNNHDYPSLADAEAEGLFHPRCLHDLSTYYEGVTRPGKNAPDPVEKPTAGYTTSQVQRRYERQIRRWKRRMRVATDPLTERTSYARVRLYQQKVRELIKTRSTTDDTFLRKYNREGGRVKLTEKARKLKPVKLN